MEDLWMAPHMIHVSILLQCPNPLAFHPLQAVPVSLDLAGGLSLSPLVFCFFLSYSCIWLSTPLFWLFFPFLFPLRLWPKQRATLFPSISASFSLPHALHLPPSPTLFPSLTVDTVFMCAFGGCRIFFWGGGGAYPIITNQKVPGGSCHRNLVHGSWRSSHPLTPPSHWQNCISHNDNNIISEAKGKKKRRREGGYRP